MRSGRDEALDHNDMMRVMSSMLVQVCMDYPGVPDVKGLTMSEIAWFYDALRPGLKKHTNS